MFDFDWERFGLVLLFIGFSIYGWFEIEREQERSKSPSHLFNRNTGKVERHDN